MQKHIDIQFEENLSVPKYRKIIDAIQQKIVAGDKLTAYKGELYYSIKSALNEEVSEQIFFHHNNLKIFQTIIESSIGDFSEYVIMPIDHPYALNATGKLPANKVFLHELGQKQYKNIYSYVCQFFEWDIYGNLRNNTLLDNKFQRFASVIRYQKSYLRDLITEVRDFWKQLHIDFEVVFDLRLYDIKPVDTFVVVDNRDL